MGFAVLNPSYELLRRLRGRRSVEPHSSDAPPEEQATYRWSFKKLRTRPFASLARDIEPTACDEYRSAGAA
jgi:hypothetical protein